MNYLNINTGQKLTESEFIALVCGTTYNCCNSNSNVWLAYNTAKTEYQWKEYFNKQNMCGGSLTLTFDDFISLPTGVTDPTSLSQWNTLFSSNYTSISVVGFVVTLSGGTNVTLTGMQSSSIISVVDTGSVVAVYLQTFDTCNLLTTINLENATTIGHRAFISCQKLTTINLPSTTTIGEGAFSAGATSTTITINIPSCTDLGGTPKYNNVFDAMSSNTITLTVPSALMTCNAGDPDGDIVDLQANNTVTIITV